MKVSGDYKHRWGVNFEINFGVNMKSMFESLFEDNV